MADIKSKEARSANMSHIRGANTKPEEKVRRFLFAHGFRYRKNDKKLPGKPDIVLPKYHTVILVHGCFWHRHQNCKYATTPKDNFDFWQRKFSSNVIRDQKVQESLLALGWKIIVIWECKTKSEETFLNTMNDVINELRPLETMENEYERKI